MRGVHGHSISVGAQCGDPRLITTPSGGTPANPCPDNAFGTGFACNDTGAEEWIGSAARIHGHLEDSWKLLESAEAAAGGTSETARLGLTYDRLLAEYDQLPKEGGWLFGTNNQIVLKNMAWMVDAACLIEQLEKATRMYQVQPLPTPTPSPSPSPSPIPGPLPGPSVSTPSPSSAAKPFSQKFGESVLMLAGIGLLGAGIYSYSQRGRGLGRGPKRPLPSPK